MKNIGKVNYIKFCYFRRKNARIILNQLTRKNIFPTTFKLALINCLEFIALHETNSFISEIIISLIISLINVVNIQLVLVFLLKAQTFEVKIYTVY